MLVISSVVNVSLSPYDYSLMFVLITYYFNIEIWLEWLKDESTLITIPSAAQELKQLFERAVEDYLCKYL